MERIGGKKLNISDPVVYIVLAISGMNFRLWGIYILGVLAVVYIAFNHRFIATKALIPISLVGVVYALSLVNVGGDLADIIKALLYPVIWLFGYIFLADGSFERLMKALTFIAYGMALHGILNLLYNLTVGNNYKTGKAYDFFTHTIVSVTGQTTNFTLIVALVFWLVFIQRNVLLKITSAVLYLLAFYYDVSIGGRTFLIMSLFSLAFSSALYLFIFLRYKDSFARGLFLLFVLIVIFVFIIIAYDHNWFSIRNVFSSTYLNTRIERGTNVVRDERFYHKSLYIKHMSEFLWGGHQLSTTYGLTYAHDIWLDIYDEAGILTFIALLFYTLCSIVRFIKVAFSKAIEPQYRIVLANLIIIVMAQFFVEPILKSVPILFFCFIAIDGMVCACLQQSGKSLQSRRLAADPAC